MFQEYLPFKNLPGSFSTNDGTIDFYLRVRTLINKKKIVLDLGASDAGWFNSKKNIRIRKKTQYLKNDVKFFYSADIESSVLKNKTSHKNLIIINNKIPLKKNSVDIIISDWTFEHVENVKVFYKEINRVLKKGGTLCARTPHKYNYFAILNSFLEGRPSKEKLLLKSQPRRKSDDYWKSFYRLNTLYKIKKIFNNFKSNSFIFVPDPSYYFGSKYLFYIFKLIHLIAPKFFSGILILFLQKK